MNNKEYLECLFDSDKPIIIYRVKGGFDVYTDFSKKINLTKDNAKNFFNKTVKKPNSRNKFFDGYVGFLSYELQCRLIGIKIPKQKLNGFRNNYFYKPETLIKIRKGIKVFSTLKNIKNIKRLELSSKKFFYEKKFNVSLTLAQYTKIFKTFSKKIREGQTYQIKICQKYRNNSNIDPVQFFWKLMKVNTSQESFMIRDESYSIISCSPETLIDKKNNRIITKPIAGTLKRNKKTTLNQAKNFFAKKTGKQLSEKQSDGEFIGMVKLNANGCKIFKKYYQIAKKKYKSKKFYNAKTFKKAYLTDFFNFLIHHKINIKCVNIKNNWMEIDTTQDYKIAQNFFKKK